ncbi:arginyl-tRNA synthetase [Propionibacteriaceae bacterium ES.041]|uniref:arginine--tRNA ligase n=1 Tax=Enemella evansiae TaxID=2016499 RepID=UPI000B962634|nr:arginine--tRNA ligase [Enemella evansiae]OYO17178.1 arginine--tRNA ligase [Enemella evansiae]PFG68984.1 arginyl-tRNA synthetase [Propionibacteriaceae bacterium ES.041]
MSSLPSELNARVAAVAGIDPELRAATKPQFGHFQSNVALRLAKSEGRPPREVAQRIVDELEVGDLCEPPEIAGPGFINFRLRNEVLAGAAEAVLTDPQVGIVATDDPQRVVIDYSAPNVAKQMHVGHLRTTIIGDCFNRVLTATGDTVIPQNHIGDWGTQFGMLIEQILDEGIEAAELDLAAADALYKRAAAHFKTDPEFATRARARVAIFQGGDEQSLAIWRQLLEISKQGFNDAYARMNVLLTDKDLAGESTYNDDLAAVCDELEANGVAVIDNGALCVFVDGFDAPLIVRKSDGGYGYATTDLAAIRRRVRELHADRIIYVTDARQSGHFRQVFAAARKAGWLPDTVRAEHIGYGMVLGEDGKPLKSRDGSAAKLVDLLDAAEQNAAPEIALAAIKYADLSSGLQKDYVFDPVRMTRTQGDTGPYLQYAHSRCCSILREAAARGYQVGPITVLDEPAEQQLALNLSRFGEVVAELAENLQPHKLCSYLFELASGYSVFYENCPVLKSEDPVRSSRLGLVQATRDVLARGLDLLGIIAPERM